jgi:hypothetical protein
MLLTLKLYIFQIFKFNSNFVFETFEPKTINTNNKKVNENKYIDTLKLTSNYNLTPEAITLSHSLSQVNFTLSKLYDSKKFEDFLYSLYFKNKTTLSLEFFIYEITNFDNDENVT